MPRRTPPSGLRPVALNLDFSGALRTSEIESDIAELERRMKQAHPEVVAVFVKPQSAALYGDASRRDRLVQTASEGA